MHIGFIGLGLIGGSLARSIRKYHPDYRLSAFSRTESTVDNAIADGVIDEKYDIHDQRFSDCDMIFLCAPVQTNISYLPFLKTVIKDTCILTDVGSVKGVMMDAAAEYGLEKQFIGGHPMAGSEKTGYESATDYLLENAYCFLTPGNGVPQEMIDTYVELIDSIKSIPMVLSPEEHDFVVAGVSHLPHLVASSLVNLVKDIDTSDGKMHQVAAGGFRDITRIASSSPDVWEQICLSNRKQISKVLSSYIDMLEEIKSAVDDGNGSEIHEGFRSSRDYRDSLNDSVSGSVPREYTLYIDIYDEAGGIATITTLLAMSSINIKNIGILHNREFEDGVLRLELYDAESRDRSLEILHNRNYKVKKKS